MNPIQKPTPMTAPALPEAATPSLMEVQERLGLFAPARPPDAAEAALEEKPLALV